MDITSSKRNSKVFLGFIVFLQLVMYMLMFFDVTIARQVFGFAYLTFIPGMIILKLLGMNDLNGLEVALFSMGFSVAFLMFVGLVINELGFLFGISEPLSFLPIAMILNSFILLGAILVWVRGKDVKLWRLKNPTFSPLALILAGLPVLSIIGAYCVNISGNNLILLLMLITISLLFIIGVIYEKLLPPKLYPFALLMVSIAILFHYSFISNYIVPLGSDVPVEYFAFKTTESNAYWGSALPYFSDAVLGRINAMPSVTILPTIYSNLLSMDPTWVFKIVSPLIFSFVPLGLYAVWQIYIGKKYAFISAFLFMAQSTFYTEMLALNRQMIAELFFVLLLFVVLSKKIKPRNKMLSFMIFSVALVMSHYALTEIFLIFISFSLISLIVLKRPNRNITASMVLFLCVVMFSWYIYTSGSTTFDSFLLFGENVITQLGEFLNPASRGGTVLRGLGMEVSPSIWNTISRTFAYVTQALIVAGFIGLILRRKKIHFDKEYVMLSVAAMGLLALLLIVPGLANTMNMTRFYHILLFFLAPFFIMGAKILIELLSKREIGVSILVLILLIPYFLFQTNFVYEVTGSDSWSLPLSKYRMNVSRLYGSLGYIDDYSVMGAKWLSKNVNTANRSLYADWLAIYTVLPAYGMIYREYIQELSNTTILAADDIVYLSYYSVVYGKVSGYDYVQQTLNKTDIVYSNGGSRIYCATER